MSSVIQRPTWDDVVLSFIPPEKRTIRARALLRRFLGLPLILLVQTALTWRLNDVINDDEALYIDSGHQIIHHMLHGGYLANYGSYFSGAPNAYPVLAGALDGFGGLSFVRFFSLVVMLVSTVCVFKTAQHLFGRRVATFSAAVFALDGSVLFIGKFATYDASCLTLIAIAIYLGVTKRSSLIGLPVGALLAIAATTKYAGAIFIPFVIGLCFLCGLSTARRDQLRAVIKSLLAIITVTGLLLLGYHLWGKGISGGINFTTTSRKALEHQPIPTLLKSLTWDIGILLILALTGLILIAHRREWLKVLIVLTCLGAGLALPVSQVHIHEFVSLDKHTAFSALFLSLPAGLALDWAFTKRGSIKIGTLVLLWLLLIDGLWRSDIQFFWPNSVLGTVHVIEHHPAPGIYISTDGDEEIYYTHIRGVDWQTSSYAYSLFGQQTSVVLTAIKSQKYEGFVYQSGDKSNGVKELAKILPNDPHYRLLAKFHVDPWHKQNWMVWQKKP